MSYQFGSELIREIRQEVVKKTELINVPDVEMDALLVSAVEEVVFEKQDICI